MPHVRIQSRYRRIVLGAVVAGAVAAATLPATAQAGVRVPLAKTVTTPVTYVVNGLHLELPCGLPAPGAVACNAVINRSASSVRPDATASAPAGYGPSDIRAAYRLPATTATPTVAIVDAMDDPNAESDLAAYRAFYGLPACTTANGCFRKTSETGTTTYPAGDTGWGGEISLDLDALSAACSTCHILLVEAASASDADLGIAENYAASQKPAAISNSYGGAESSTSAAESAANYQHPGIAITVSAGDAGYGVEFPASSQYVTAVGGTTLTKDTSARGYTETVWGGAGFLGLYTPDGTGSGCSAYIAKPTWQKDAKCTKRTVADVSAVADPSTGLAVYDTYGENGWLEVGGTSLSSPLIATVYALAGNTGVGSATTTPASLAYSHPGALFDVTSGTNGSCSKSYLCTAVAGYDGPTGLGTPNGIGAF